MWAGVGDGHFLGPIRYTHPGDPRAHHMVGRESHSLHITRSRTIAHHVRWRCLLSHHWATRRNGLETLTPRSHTGTRLAHGGSTGTTKSHGTWRTRAHIVRHLVHHVIWIPDMRPHHLVVFWWRLPILILHMHVLLMLHLLLRVLLLLLHLHHLYLLRGHLTPHVGVGTSRTAHGSHPVVGSHFHLVGSHHLHLLHALVLHHLHLLLLAHDTRGRHLLSHSRIRHVGNVTRISHGTLLSSRHSHATWRTA